MDQKSSKSSTNKVPMDSTPKRVQTSYARPRVPRGTCRMAPARRHKMATKDIRTDNEEGRLLLSNLGPDIAVDDIKRVFSGFGIVGKIIHHCTKDKVSLGTAEVWMSSGTDAAKAKTKLNASDLFNDGRIIRIERPRLTTKFSKFWKMVFKFVEKISKDNTRLAIKN